MVIDLWFENSVSVYLGLVKMKKKHHAGSCTTLDFSICSASLFSSHLSLFLMISCKDWNVWGYSKKPASKDRLLLNECRQCEEQHPNSWQSCSIHLG